MALPQKTDPGRQRRSLTAAAASYTAASKDDGYSKRAALPWQQRALTYIDIVPELSYSSRFYARMLRQLRIYPAVAQADGTYEPIKEGPAVEHMNRLRSRGGRIGPVLGSYGRLMFSTGEGNLLGLKIDTPDEYWMFTWLDEVVVERNSAGDVVKIIHRPVNNGEVKEYEPNEARVYRLWSPHPRRSGEADSPMRSVLDIAEELIVLTAAVRATATSRTTRGILLMPIEMAPLPAEQTGDEDEESDLFIDEMLSHLESQIENAGSAAAAAPWVIWGAYELLDRVRRVELHDPALDYAEISLRKEAIDRLSRGLDYPPEVLNGMSSANHWAAKQIFDDMWRSHGVAVADQLVGDLTEVYLRPYLREIEFPDWENVVVSYDETKVVLPPDQSQDADAAYDRGEISGVGYRALKNIDPKYAPSKEERDLWIAIKFNDPSIAGLRPMMPVDAAPPEPPPPGTEGDSGRDSRTGQAAIEVGAAEMALARCRELAGIRIKQRERAPGSGKTPPIYAEILSQINGKPDGAIAAYLGPEKVALLDVDPAKLVQGGAATLRTVLEGWGYGYSQAVTLASMVESYAARTLFKEGPPTLPNGFAAHFERAKEASHVGD